jgi:dTDP-4-dehydrorhamnose 3,5-epimerase
MKFIKTAIEGLVEIHPRIFEDERGFFFESYSRKAFEDNAISEVFVQDNQSFSVKGVLRGLHFQKDPFAQGKLVSVVKGRVLDVAVDIRPESSTFGKYELFELDDKKKNMVYIPAGFAHGFLALEESIFSYKCTNLYHKASESGISWNDPDLDINWGITDPIVSSKDIELPTFKDYRYSNQ